MKLSALSPADARLLVLSACVGSLLGAGPARNALAEPVAAMDADTTIRGGCPAGDLEKLAYPPAAPDLPFDPTGALTSFEAALRDLYAYGDAVDRDALMARLRDRAPGLDPEGVRRLLHRAALAFVDPHLLVGPLDDDDPNVWPTSSDLVVEGGMGDWRVADVRAGSAADAAGVRPGWRVVTVDGRPLDEAVEVFFEGLVPAPSAEQAAWAATLLLNGRRRGDRAVRFADSSVLDLPNPRLLAQQVSERAPVTVGSEDGVAILRIENALGRAETIAAFDAAMQASGESRALVLDLRNTPSGGNTDVARGLMGWFTEAAAPYQMHTVPAVERASTVPRRFVEYVEPRGNRFAGPVVVLGGRWTGSMGEGLVIGMSALGAHTVCSDLGDLLGALHRVELDGLDATLELGAEALFHVDGTPREDYVCDESLPSADRDRAGEDPALRAALAWVNGQGASTAPVAPGAAGSPARASGR